MRHDPHLLIEGALLASFAMRAHACYIYVRGEFIREREHLEAAVDEAYEAKLIGKDNIHGWDFDFFVHHGAGAYICGEETALLESLEGKKGMPRLKPPFPANAGLYGAPDHGQQRRIDRRRAGDILRRGAAWFAGLGKPNNTGTKLFQISGHVEQPCVVEEEMGIPLRELIERHCRRRARRLGQPAGRDPRRLVDAAAAGRHLPGPDAGFRRAVQAEIRHRHGGRDRHGQVDRRHRAPSARIAYFYKHESCGQCTPCREGCGWMWRVLERMERGEAEKREIDLLFDVTKQVEGHTICALGDAAAWPVQGLIRHFRPEIEARIDAPGGRASRRRSSDASLRRARATVDLARADDRFA